MNSRQAQIVRAVIWLAASLAAAVGLAWVSIRIQHRFSPLLLMPALLGLAIGGLVATMAKALEIRSRRSSYLVSAAAALTMAVSLHYLAFREYREQVLQSAAKQESLLVQLALPELAPGTTSFDRFLVEAARRGRTIGRWRIEGAAVWGLWLLEALVAAGASLAAVYWTREMRFVPDTHPVGVTQGNAR
jgi:hypothetical protein